MNDKYFLLFNSYKPITYSMYFYVFLFFWELNAESSKRKKVNGRQEIVKKIVI